jgi:hypothetical protein
MLSCNSLFRIINKKSAHPCNTAFYFILWVDAADQTVAPPIRHSALCDFDDGAVVEAVFASGVDDGPCAQLTGDD